MKHLLQNGNKIISHETYKFFENDLIRILNKKYLLFKIYK